MYHGEILMTGSGPAMMSHPLVDMPDVETVDTRFGKVMINRKLPIVFANGLLGLPDKQNFCLTNFPSETLARFKLLQSLEDAALSFITLPVDLENSVVDKADLEQAARDLEIPMASLAILFIVTVHRDSTGVKLSVNARAPLLLDVSKRLAVQFVFPNPKYDIRHMITV
jgi:flagellar assembly factor FliW